MHLAPWMESKQNRASEETTGMRVAKWKRSGVIRNEEPGWRDLLKDQQSRAKSCMLSGLCHGAPRMLCPTNSHPDTRQDARDVPHGIPEGKNDPMHTHNVLVDMGWQRKIEQTLHSRAPPSLPRCLSEHGCCYLLSQVSMATGQAPIS